jgi:heme/copper-type cytochrome/quinol oxidase subunit 2
MTRRAQFVVIAICLLLVPSILSACPVCYGAPNSPMTKSSNNAIMFMLGVVAFVQIGFIALFWTFWRRAKELRRRRESFHVLDGGAAL